jgi:hypothetical protein
MERVDQASADKLRHSNKKQMKRIQRDNPTITKDRLKLMAGDPLISKLHPLKYFGAISEKIDDKLN